MADGYPSGDGGPGSGVSDPTAAAVLRRDRLARAHAAILADLDRLAAIAYSIERAMNYYGPPPVDTSAQANELRCAVDPLCERNGDRRVNAGYGKVWACRTHYEAVGRGEIDGYTRIREDRLTLEDRGLSETRGAA